MIATAMPTNSGEKKNEVLVVASRPAPGWESLNVEAKRTIWQSNDGAAKLNAHATASQGFGRHNHGQTNAQAGLRYNIRF